MGRGVLYNKGYQMIEQLIHSDAVDTSFDNFWNLINFYEDQKEVGVRTDISHK